MLRDSLRTFAQYVRWIGRCEGLSNITKSKNHPAGFKAEFELDTIHEEIRLVELSKNYCVHANQTSTWKGSAIKKMAPTFSRCGGEPRPGNKAELENLHSGIAQLVVERVFAKAPRISPQRPKSITNVSSLTCNPCIGWVNHLELQPHRWIMAPGTQAPYCQAGRGLCAMSAFLRRPDCQRISSAMHPQTIPISR